MTRTELHKQHISEWAELLQKAKTSGLTIKEWRRITHRVDKPLAGLTPLRTRCAAFPHPAPCKADYSTVIGHIH